MHLYVLLLVSGCSPAYEEEDKYIRLTNRLCNKTFRRSVVPSSPVFRESSVAFASRSFVGVLATCICCGFGLLLSFLAPASCDVLFYSRVCVCLRGLSGFCLCVFEVWACRSVGGELLLGVLVLDDSLTRRTLEGDTPTRHTDDAAAASRVNQRSQQASPLHA